MADDIDPKTGLRPGEFDPTAGAQRIAVPTANKAGPGSTVVAIAAVGREVVLQFPTAVAWCALDPQTAVNVGEALAREAHKIRFGYYPKDNVHALADEIKRKATDVLRRKMITRTMMIMRSLIEKNRPPEIIATEVVDRVLQEVL